nr:transposase zinc-binding domain-containing protein [Mediterraneibacter hominis]
MLYILHPRISVIENVEKMIHCGGPSFGGAMYHCPHCRENGSSLPFAATAAFAPLKCTKCGKIMLLLEIYYNHHPVSLQELYEKAMQKHLPRSPAKSKFLLSPLHS